MERREKDFEVLQGYGSSDNGTGAPQHSNTELDLPPEFCRYPDEGCELAESCLDCPYPKCVEDRYDGKRDRLRALRDREIVRQFSAGTKTIEEIARIFRVSIRTARRALRKKIREK